MFKAFAEAAVKAFHSRNKAAARKVLADPEASATALYAACQALLGPGWLMWLHEVVCHELEAEGMAECHGDAIGALQSTACTGAPWRDYRAFAATASAFAGHPIHVHGFEPPDAHHMAAAIPEMLVVFALDDVHGDAVPEFSDEVEAYIAAALAHQGFCCAPDQLDFCQEKLDALVCQHTCSKAKKSDGSKSADCDPSEEIQAQRYAEVKEYVELRLKHATEALRTFN